MTFEANSIKVRRQRLFLCKEPKLEKEKQKKKHKLTIKHTCIKTYTHILLLPRQTIKYEMCLLCFNKWEKVIPDQKKIRISRSLALKYRCLKEFVNYFLITWNWSFISTERSAPLPESATLHHYVCSVTVFCFDSMLCVHPVHCSEQINKALALVCF